MQGVALQGQLTQRGMDQGLGVASPRPRLRHLPELAELGQSLRARSASSRCRPTSSGRPAAALRRLATTCREVAARCSSVPATTVSGGSDGSWRNLSRGWLRRSGDSADQSPCNAEDIAFQARMVALGADHHRGQVGEPLDQPRRMLGRTNISMVPRLRCRDAGQVEDMVTLVGVEPQCPDERADHLVRGVRATTLLETHHVVHADPRRASPPLPGAARERDGASRQEARRPGLTSARRGHDASRRGCEPRPDGRSQHASAPIALGRTAGPTTSSLWLADLAPEARWSHDRHDHHQTRTETTVALVTGANKGLGLETVRRLATLGWTVWLGARDRGERRGLQLESIRAEQPTADVRFVQLDVTSDDSVLAARDVVASAEGARRARQQRAAIAGGASDSRRDHTGRLPPGLRRQRARARPGDARASRRS